MRTITILNATPKRAPQISTTRLAISPTRPWTRNAVSSQCSIAVETCILSRTPWWHMSVLSRPDGSHPGVGRLSVPSPRSSSRTNAGRISQDLPTAPDARTAVPRYLPGRSLGTSRILHRTARTSVVLEIEVSVTHMGLAILHGIEQLEGGLTCTNVIAEK